MKNIQRTLALLTLACLLGGCSDFQNQWDVIAKKPTPTTNITGLWTGSWMSDVDAHTGEIKAIVRKVDDQTYDVYYHATYGSFFTFSYETQMHVTQRTGDRVDFTGKADLGWLAGGEYEHTGHATPTEFVSKYRSKYDHGAYTMKRPEPEAAASPPAK